MRWRRAEAAMSEESRQEAARRREAHRVVAAANRMGITPQEFLQLRHEGRVADVCRTELRAALLRADRAGQGLLDVDDVRHALLRPLPCGVEVQPQVLERVIADLPSHPMTGDIAYERLPDRLILHRGVFATELGDDTAVGPPAHTRGTSFASGWTTRTATSRSASSMQGSSYLQPGGVFWGGALTDDGDASDTKAVAALSRAPLRPGSRVMVRRPRPASLPRPSTTSLNPDGSVTLSPRQIDALVQSGVLEASFIAPRKPEQQDVSGGRPASVLSSLHHRGTPAKPTLRTARPRAELLCIRAGAERLAAVVKSRQRRSMSQRLRTWARAADELMLREADVAMAARRCGRAPSTDSDT